MPTPTRIVVPVDSMDSQSWKLALGCADAIAAKQGLSDVVLLTHTKDQLRHTSLATFLGDNSTKALDKGHALALPSGAKVRHATKQTVSPWLRNAVVVVAYGEDGILNFVDGLGGLAGVVVVPDFEDSANRWVERWNPAVLGQDPKEAARLIDDPVVENALRSLETWVNLANGVLNARDKGHVTEALRILRAKGHIVDPEKAKSWAIRNKWKPGAADDLANIFRKMNKMKTKPTLTGIHNAEGRYERWRSNASKSD